MIAEWTLDLCPRSKATWDFSAWHDTVCFGRRVIAGIWDGNPLKLKRLRFAWWSNPTCWGNLGKPLVLAVCWVATNRMVAEPREKSLKDTERKQTASRVWSRLTRPAKAVARNLKKLHLGSNGPWSRQSLKAKMRASKAGQCCLSFTELILTRKSIYEKVCAHTHTPKAPLWRTAGECFMREPAMAQHCVAWEGAVPAMSCRLLWAKLGQWEQSFVSWVTGLAQPANTWKVFSQFLGNGQRWSWRLVFVRQFLGGKNARKTKTLEETRR